MDLDSERSGMVRGQWQEKCLYRVKTGAETLLDFFKACDTRDPIWSFEDTCSEETRLTLPGQAQFARKGSNRPYGQRVYAAFLL